MRKTAILTAALALLATAVSCADKNEIKPTKNIILMIPDGTSTSVLSVVRWYREYQNPQNGEARLATDPYICGLVRQNCSDAPVAASPAAMTSFMTGYRVQANNLGVYPANHGKQDLVAVNPDSAWQPLATVLEAAKILKHKSTGYVVTVRAGHATPAGTASHVLSRTDDFNIMRQISSNAVDVVFGGGCQFVDDGVKQILEDKGITYIEKNLNAFREHNETPVWALFADDQMAFDIDRDTLAEPSLDEMTRKAISLLSKDKNGFFLMVEGSKVDYAAHSNDPLGIISEYDAFDKAVATAIEFAKKDGNTTVIVVPDHGNSAMTIGDRNYTGYYRKGLDSVFVKLPEFKGTAYALSCELQKCSPDSIKSVFKSRTGIELTPAQEKSVRSLLTSIEQDYMQVSYSANLMSVVTDIVNKNTHLGYVSGSHTGEDVFLAVYNPNDQTPRGWIEGTSLAGYMSELLGIEGTLDDLTSDIYVKSDVLLDGHQTSVEDGIEPVLVVDGKVRIPANRSFVEVDGQRKELSSVSVYIPSNKTFYISKEILKYL